MTINRNSPFDYQVPTEEQTIRIMRFREMCKDLYGEIMVSMSPSRERSLAITKLEEVSMWGNKAIVFEPRAFIVSDERGE